MFYKYIYSPAYAILLTLFLVVSETAAGQVDTPPKATPESDGSRPPLETVTVTATRRALDEREVTAALTRLDAEDVLRDGPSVVAEALRGQPGAYFQQTTPGQGTPIIRGLKGSQVLHLVDGMRLNNAFFRDAPNQYLALVDPLLVERVEVLRGAAGSLYGADAMGGVVALGTREATFAAEDINTRGRILGRYESADSGLIGRASGAVGNRRGSLAGGVSWQQRRDRRTGNGETVRPSAFESRAGDLKARYVGVGGEWMLQAQVLEQPATPRVDELVPGFGQETPASEVFLFEPNHRSFLHGRYRGETTRPWLERWEINLARQVIVDDRRTQDFGSTLENREQNESTLDGLTVLAQSRLSPALDLVWGAESYRDEVRSTRRLTELDTGQARDVRGRFPDGASQDSDAVYGQLNWAASDALTVEAGLRYSRFKLVLPASGSEPDVRLTPDDLTGDLRLRLTLRDEMQLLANVGRGFRPPNVFDLGTLGPRPGNRFNVANPTLAPETVWSVDLGLRAWGVTWQAELFAFLLDYDDKIASVPTGELTESGRIVVRSDNRAEAEIYGLEAALTWQLTSALTLDATLNVTRGTERTANGPETPGDRIPPLNGRVGLRWDVADDWRLGAWTAFASKQDRLSPRDRLDPRIDPEGTDGWITLNARGEWRVTPILALGLQLSNLLDEAYREHGSGIDAPGRSLGLWFDAAF